MNFGLEVYDANSNIRLSSEGIISRILANLSATLPANSSSYTFFVPNGKTEDHLVFTISFPQDPFEFTYTKQLVSGGMNVTINFRYSVTSSTLLSLTVYRIV